MLRCPSKLLWTCRPLRLNYIQSTPGDVDVVGLALRRFSLLEILLSIQYTSRSFTHTGATWTCFVVFHRPHLFGIVWRYAHICCNYKLYFSLVILLLSSSCSRGTGQHRTVISLAIAVFCPMTGDSLVLLNENHGYIISCCKVLQQGIYGGYDREKFGRF